jgi:hypothetical protein
MFNTLIYEAFTSCNLFHHAIRAQAWVGNEQFLQAMIPHHSAAVLMCRQASVTDPETVNLCQAHYRVAIAGNRLDAGDLEAILQDGADAERHSRKKPLAVSDRLEHAEANAWIPHFDQIEKVGDRQAATRIGYPRKRVKLR